MKPPIIRFWNQKIKTKNQTLNQLLVTQTSKIFKSKPRIQKQAMSTKLINQINNYLTCHKRIRKILVKDNRLWETKISIKEGLKNLKNQMLVQFINPKLNPNPNPKHLQLQSKLKEKELLVQGMLAQLRTDKFERNKTKNDSIQLQGPGVQMTDQCQQPDDHQLWQKLKVMEETVNRLQIEKQKLLESTQPPVSQQYIKDYQIKVEQLVKEQQINNEKIQKIEYSTQESSKNDFENIQQLQKSLQDLKIQYSLVQSELSNSKQLKQSQDQLIHNLKHNRKGELSSLEKNIESSSLSLLKLQEQLADEKNKVYKLNLTISQNSEEFKASEQKLTNIIEIRTNEIRLLEDFIKKKDSDSKNTTMTDHTINNLIRDNSDLKKQNLEKSKQLESLKDQLIQLEQQYEYDNQNNQKKLESSLKVVFNQELNDTKNRFCEKIFELENDLKRQQNRNTLYESKLQTLREKADDSNKNYVIRSQELQNLMIQTSESNRITQHLTRQEKENQDLREQVELMKDVISQLQFQNCTSTFQIEKFDTKYQDNQEAIQTKFQNFQNDFDVQTKIIAQKEENLQAKLRIIEEQRVESHKLSDNYQYNLKQLQEEIQKFRNLLAQESDSHKCTRQRLNTLEQRLTDAENWIVENQKIKQDLEQEIKSLHLQLNELNQSKILVYQVNQQLEYGKSIIAHQVQEKEINIRDQQDIINLKEQKIIDQGAFIDQLQAQIRSNQQHIESIKYESTCYQDELKIQISKVQYELQETRASYNQSQSEQVRILKQEIQNLKQNTLVLEESWTQRYNSFQQELKEKSQQIYELNSQQYQLQNFKIEQSKNEKTEYRVRCSDLESIVKEIATKNETLEANINALNTQLNDKNTQITQLIIQLQQNKIELSRIAMDNKVLGEQIQKLQQFDRQTSKIKELESDIYVLNQCIQEQEIELNNHRLSKRDNLKIISMQEDDLEKWRNNFFSKEKQLQSLIQQHEQINNVKIVQNEADQHNTYQKAADQHYTYQKAADPYYSYQNTYQNAADLITYLNPADQHITYNNPDQHITYKNAADQHVTYQKENMRFNQQTVVEGSGRIPLKFQKTRDRD